MRRCLDKVLIRAGCLTKCSVSIRHCITTVFLVMITIKPLKNVNQELVIFHCTSMECGLERDKYGNRRVVEVWEIHVAC